MKYAAAVGFCAVLALCVVESSARSLGGGPASAVLTRLRRAGPIEWDCEHNIDGCLLHINCTTNLQVKLHQTRCQLDGRDYPCDRLNFAVDLSSGLSDRFNHLFILTARANYGSGYASLPWHFRFKTDPEDECDTPPPPPTTPPPAPSPTTPPPPPTTPPPSPTPTTPPPPSTVVCNSSQDGSDIVINCTSSDGVEIILISYFINGVPVGSSVRAQISIPGYRLIEGDNSVLLTITTSDGRRHEVRLTVQRPSTTPPPAPSPITSPPPPPPPTTSPPPPPPPTTSPPPPPPPPPSTDPNRTCSVRCSGRTSSTHVDITCTVDGDLTGAQLTSIVYTVNNGPSRLADGLPSFRIGTSELRNGANSIALTVSHSECGRANLNLNVQFQIPPDPSRTCRFRCSGQSASNGAYLEINCTVDGSGAQITSINYTINDGQSQSAHAIADGLRSFMINTSQFRNGANSIALTVSHSECGIANLNMNVQLPRSTNPPPADRTCRFRCSGQSVLNGAYLEITCTVDGSGVQLTSIVYTVNNESSQFADELTSFMINTSQFRNGANSIALTVSHSDCGRANLNLNVQVRRSTNPQPTNPPPVCAVNCRYLQVENSTEFTCQTIGGSGRIFWIRYAINNAPPEDASLSSGGVFRIPLNVFQNGDNTVDLSILVLCADSIVTLDRSLILSVQVPQQEVFTVTVISVDPENYGSLVASFPIICEVAVEVDNLVISVSPTGGSQRVLLIGFSVNGLRVQYRVGAVVRIPKDVFVNGQNQVELTVFGNGGARIDKTITLRVQKG